MKLDKYLNEGSDKSVEVVKTKNGIQFIANKGNKGVPSFTVKLGEQTQADLWSYEKKLKELRNFVLK